MLVNGLKVVLKPVLFLEMKTITLPNVLLLFGRICMKSTVGAAGRTLVEICAPPNVA